MGRLKNFWTNIQKRHLDKNQINARLMSLVVSLKTKNIFRNILLITISTIFALASVEALLRITQYKNKKIDYYIWPPYLSLTVEAKQGLLPGINSPSHFEINSIGLRGNEYEEDAALHVLMLGGSTTECSFVDQQQVWPLYMGKKISSQLEKNVWVGSGGKSGQTLRDNILEMKYFESQLPKVDIVVVLVGVNDFMQRLKDPTYSPDFLTNIETQNKQLSHAFYIYPQMNSFPHNTAIWDLLRKIKRGYLQKAKLADNTGEFYIEARKLRQESKKIDTLPDLTEALDEYQKNLEYMIQDAQKKSVKIIFLTQPTLWKSDMSTYEEKLLWFGCLDDQGVCYTKEALNWGMNQYNERLLEVCKKNKIDCIDLANLLPKSTSTFYDDVHFNTSGSIEIANILADFLIMRGYI